MSKTWKPHAGGHAGTGHRAPTIVLLVLVFGVSAGGCYRSPSAVTVYEPGVYKGTPDPLVEKSGTPEYAAALRERFSIAATDR